MTILLKTGVAKSLGSEARWELHKNFEDDTPALVIRLFQPLHDSPGMRHMATLTIDRMDGEGKATFTDTGIADNGLDPVPLAGMLVYANEETWAHVALDIFNNS